MLQQIGTGFVDEGIGVSCHLLVQKGIFESIVNLIWILREGWVSRQIGWEIVNNSRDKNHKFAMIQCVTDDSNAEKVCIRFKILKIIFILRIVGKLCGGGKLSVYCAMSWRYRRKMQKNLPHLHLTLGSFMDALEKIKQQVQSHPVIIYMKGTPQFPQCGYSARAVETLKKCEVEFAYINVLTDKEVYENLPKFANWPTFPQIYVNGELIGGCDIVVEMFQKNELKPLLTAAIAPTH
jgi:monothiol glutaredoxin